MSTDLRAIAFYLPQFHPVRENDEWWGTGFTEWRNVARARPLFAGHYQPHLPADLGFYDLRLPEIREAQATLARDHGLHGFCYYHYWFNGRRILERPFNEVLASGKPNFPFCLCWANENWTRAWNGGEKDILLGQQYNHADDLTHINSLFPAFEDARYIRINGKPLFIVYRTQLMPNPARTAEIWREAALKAGIGELYLARVESFGEDLNPETIGFDADIEFAPNWRRLGSPLHRDRFSRWLIKLGVLPDVYLKQTVATYEGMIQGMLSKPVPNHVRFRGVTPGFDNSARRAEGAAILVESKPEKYAGWLREIARQTLQKQQGDERLIFINAWNEWAEGNHLEPDLQNGHAYLQATADVLRPLNV
ncbi:MAG: glycoside hydrolase family 99-like domain-containing protein [Pseudomonadota bacterium]